MPTQHQFSLFLYVHLDSMLPGPIDVGGTLPGKSTGPCCSTQAWRGAGDPGARLRQTGSSASPSSL